MTDKKLLNIKIDALSSYDVVIEKIHSYLKNSNQGSDNIFEHNSIICTTNPEIYLKAQQDIEFQDVINKSFLSVPDGIGILWALSLQEYANKLSVHNRMLRYLALMLRGFFLFLKLLIKPKYLGSTIKGVDLLDQMCDLASKNNYSVYFLGGRPQDSFGRTIQIEEEVSITAAKKLKLKYPTLNIVGATSAYTPQVSDDISVCSHIKKDMKSHNVSSIDMLFVAYSFGSQEKWLERNMSNINVHLGMGVGGSFDFISGHVKRAPKIFQELNMEWLYRVITQPYRIFRIFNACVIFPLYIVHCLSNKHL